MMFSSFMVLFVSSAITNWTQGQDSRAVVSIQMEKRASFDEDLPLTSACYNSEIDNTSPVQCASQCLTRPDVCHGILFNRESDTCKLLKCDPADAFSEGQLNTGRWDLLWKENEHGSGYCKPGWLKHEEHCYFFNETRDTWINSRKMCEENGGSLPSIRSSEENSWIVTTFLPPWDKVTCTRDKLNCCGYWIGGTDFLVEGVFTWTSDNSSLSFVNWYPGEPNNFNSNEDCVSMCRNEQWNDDNCDNYYPYICKTPAM